MQEAERYSRERYRDILNANPWMAGRLVRDQGKPVIVAPAAINDELFAGCDVDASLLQINPPGVNINPSMSALEMGKHAAKADIPWGYAAIDNKHAPLVRLVLVPCRNADGTAADTAAGGAADFCVLWYSSHVAGDGRTHYQMLSMFSSEQPVKSLNVTRTLGLNDKVQAIMGYDVVGWLRSSAHMLNYMYNALCRKKPQFFNAFVDHERVSILKAEATSASTEAPFVSTNDVLMSSLGRLTGARILLMPVDFRGRVSGVGDSDAGNYASTMLFDDGVYKTPAGIRKAVNSMKEQGASQSTGPAVVGRTKPLPSVMRFRSDKFAGMTNWSSFHKNVVVPGCEEVLHLPGGDFESLLGWIAYDDVVLYRAHRDQLAALVFSKDFSEEDYFRAMPLKPFVTP